MSEGKYLIVDCINFLVSMQSNISFMRYILKNMQNSCSRREYSGGPQWRVKIERNEEACKSCTCIDLAKKAMCVHLVAVLREKITLQSNVCLASEEDDTGKLI